MTRARLLNRKILTLEVLHHNMLVEAIISNNYSSCKTILHERIQKIIEKRLAEIRFDIIQDEFSFLNENISLTAHKTNRKVSFAKSFAKKKIYKDPDIQNKPNKSITSTKPTGYKRIGGKLVPMSSLEKFNRRAAKKKAVINTTQHTNVAVRKRQQVLQKRKALGITKDKTNGSTH